MLLTSALSASNHIPSGQLTLEDLPEVRGALYEVCAKWYDIGVELRLSIGALNAIRKNFPDTADCLREMCSNWLRCVNPSPSWEALIKVLASPPVGEWQLAQQLRDKYCDGREEMMTHIYSGTPPTSEGSCLY